MTQQPRTEPEPQQAPAGEAELSRRVAQGDLQAAEKLAEITYGKIYASLVRLTGGDRELAADLTQDTYRRAWVSLHTFRGGARFSTWLYRIAYNLFLNHVRKPNRLAPLDEEQSEAIADTAKLQDETLAGLATAGCLRRAVLDLPDDLRFAVTARYWAEQPVRWIAAEEGISAVGIRKRLLRAYARLAETLGEIEDPPKELPKELK